MKRLAIGTILLLLFVGVLFAQRFRGGGFRGGGEGFHESAPFRTAREAPTHSTEFPVWTNAPGYEKDVFTFVRVRFHRVYARSYRAGNCFTDFPDADLDLSFRLQQMTALKVDPDGRVVNLTDDDLSDFPFLYMVEPGGIQFSEGEVRALRKYLLNGGFLMADDFWGTIQWNNFAREFKRVFPEREFVELPMDHPVFHSVFDLGKDKNKLQTPNFGTGERSQFTNPPETWEEHEGEECIDVHIRALFDDKNRIMVIACHNTDNGDGWEREQEYQYFFKEFSEKRAYPLGINIIFYAMTH